jgi:hypothetical protein
MKTLTPSILLLLFCSAANAEWKFSGSAGPYLNQLGIQSSTVTQSQKSGIYSELKLENKINSNWRFRSDFIFRTDFVARDSIEFFQWIPKNFYLQKKQGSLIFKAGFQTLAVDGPDVVNPADIIHARNWIDPTSPLTMSSAGISVAQELNEWNWELFYVPRQTPAVLPGEHSPWLPRQNRLPIESEDLEIRIPDNVRYQYLSAKELNNALDNNVTLKVQRKSERLEVQALYYNGLSQSPFLTTQVTGTLISVNPDVILVESPVRLKPLYYRHQALAGTFVIPFESWAIRGGINWLKPQGSDDRVPKETTLMVAGFEKSIETPIGLITGIADYVRQERQDANQISFLRSVFEEAVTFGGRIPWGEETTFFAGGLYDLVGSSSMYKISASHRLSNSWSVEGAGQFLQGPSETLVGLYDRYDSYQIKTMFYW